MSLTCSLFWCKFPQNSGIFTFEFLEKAPKVEFVVMESFLKNFNTKNIDFKLTFLIETLYKFNKILCGTTNGGEKEKHTF